MNTAEFGVAGSVVFAEEAAGISAHALGVTLSGADSDMKRFERMHRERLIEQHNLKVAALNAQIDGFETHVSDLRQQISKMAKRENYLMLALAALAMLVAYFYLRDLGCAAPSWASFSGS